MIIDMSSLPGASDGILAGALNGRKAFSELVERTAAEPNHPHQVYLDFRSSEVATASFLREAVLEFRDTIRRKRSNWYPLVANCNDLVVEELLVLISTTGSAIMMCFLSREGKPFELNLLGKLDPKQQITFDLVNEIGETDAGQLMNRYGDKEGKRVVQTAWNNRLSSLANLGLIIEQKQGRAKKYSPLYVED